MIQKLLSYRLTASVKQVAYFIIISLPPSLSPFFSLSFKYLKKSVLENSRFLKSGSEFDKILVSEIPSVFQTH